MVEINSFARAIASGYSNIVSSPTQIFYQHIKQHFTRLVIIYPFCSVNINQSDFLRDAEDQYPFIKILQYSIKFNILYLPL